jgi:hypothetical protein
MGGSSGAGVGAILLTLFSFLAIREEQQIFFLIYKS